MKENDLAALRFQAAARDLDHIVRHIAGRYVVQGVPLTWRLLHGIEAEALADLGFASRHEADVLDLFKRPEDMTYPETDDPATFGKSNALPMAFAFAVAAYEDAQNAPSPDKRTHRQDAPRQPRGVGQ
ncbi:serine/threonine protein kinase [Trinickia dabaoshanensis]|uniref:Serine/threonine protein kinase n=1 Tax=Trinickia dabaoshanensis TaxID=564714 RepID=A0A2N7VFR8_9BURK|nr:DUF2471 family protein [Trinickia dabaoshanensis]PMS15997.1 serine/threonine protein kinase [Trinickia dabaoshanensis]